MLRPYMNECAEHDGRVAVIGISRHRLLTDGEGVTSLVGLSGCPLRCRYCLNSQCWFYDDAWRRYSPRELYDLLRCDDLYFRATGGGVTFGGGEPLLHVGFISRFREVCGDAWRISVETSLNVSSDDVVRIMSVADDLIVDVKDMNADIYSDYTQVDNARVIENLRLLADSGWADRIIVRTPLIPSYNTASDVDESVRQLQSMGFKRIDRFKYLPRIAWFAERTRRSDADSGTRTDKHSASSTGCSASSVDNSALLVDRSVSSVGHLASSVDNNMADVAPQVKPDYGKAVCEVLRRIRQMVASANDIDFLSHPCSHVTCASGTCPVCESEARFISKCLARKERQGGKVVI